MDRLKEMSNRKKGELSKQILGSGESVFMAYTSKTCNYIFTGRRIIQQIFSVHPSQHEGFLFIPQSKISAYSISCSELGSELNFWVLGHNNPIKLVFDLGVDIYEVQRALSDCIY